MIGNENYLRNTREKRKRKRKMRAYICMGIMCAACLFSFWLGRNVGMAQIREKEQAEVAVMDVIGLESTEADEEEPESAEADEDVQESTMPEKGETGNAEADEEEPESSEDGQMNSGEDGQESPDNVMKEQESTKDDGDGQKSAQTDKEEQEGSGASELPDIDKSTILLVNKTNKLPADYEVVLKRLPDGTNRAAEEAYEPMCNMLKAAREEGMYLEVCSSYRSVNRQKQLFEEDMERFISKGYSYLDAYDATARYTMPPGYSEHSTGLAFDIVALSYQMLNSKQATTAENKWLQEHCAEYGFILRYPEGKEEITGVAHESWHFRYVGVEAAEYIMKEGLTLEEFLEQ